VTALSRQELEVLLAQLRAEVKRDDSKAQRYMTPNGPAPGVTTVLKQLDKPALLFWASKMQSEACEAEVMAWLQEPEDARGDLLHRLTRIRQAHKNFSRRAADMGKEGHALAEYEFRRRLGLDAVKPELEYPQQAHAVCSGVMEWAKTNDVEPLSMEAPVWSIKYGFAGSWDLFASVRGTNTVVDFKSNDRGRIYRESYLQNHALRGALKEHGVEASGIVVVVPRDGQGDINPVEIPWSDATYKAFLGLLNVHRWDATLPR